MSFIADKQSLDDLNLLGKYKSGSIFNLFNRVQTAGGEKLLESMFQQPLQDAAAINQRSKVLQHFQHRTYTFPFRPEQVKAMENYLSAATGSNIVASTTNAARMRVLKMMGVQQEYNEVTTGLQATLEVLQTLSRFLTEMEVQDAANPFREELLRAQHILQDKRLSWLNDTTNAQQLSLLNQGKYDHTLRHALHEEMKTVLRLIYQLDVLLSVATVAREKGFQYATALPADDNIIDITGLYHPALSHAIANDLALNGDSNVLFLTGANMAGKSTFMKSFGIAVYLAHMGFPLAVRSMRFSIRDGLYSSINVPDNLKMGYSHFYAEVLRVKKVAEEVSEGKNLVVIFDELFKGTNVKDAYDATLAVSEAFAENRNCAYIISTHIIEVGQELKRCSNFRFMYLPAIMKGSVPTYTYTLQEGITTDRHGMMIIENEQIIETILSQKPALH